jgi:hypothetical protein
MSGAFGRSWPEILNALKDSIIRFDVKKRLETLERNTLSLWLLRLEKILAG